MVGNASVAQDSMALRSYPPVAIGRGPASPRCYGLQATFGYSLCRRRGGEKLQQCPARLGLLGTCRNAAGEYRNFLNFRWQRADQIDARNREELADLLEAELGLSAGNDRADGFGRNHPTLAEDLIVDAQTLKKHGG